jgi:hypothetical protein
MTAPAGNPTFDRVVMSVGEPLREALDNDLQGYAEIVPQAGLLGDAAGCCRLWFEDGVPVGATHTGTGRTDAAALADIAETGPYRVRLVAVADPSQVQPGDLPPDAPAEQVVGDSDLAERTRERASGDGEQDGADLDAVEAFLADEEKIEAIKQRAAMEARERAAEWDLPAED